MADKRQYQRIHFESDVELQIGELVCSVHLYDLSLHGAMLSLPSHIPAQQGLEVQLTIPLAGLDDTIHVSATVQYIATNSMGLEFAKVDIDSMSRLRRLLEMNQVDEEAMQRELATLATPK